MIRTTDVSFGEDYFGSLDGGAGYRDSMLWVNVSCIVHELFGVDKNGHDYAGDVNVLDVGCAFGYSVRWLRRQGFDAWGVDISDYALAHAPEDIATYLRPFDLTKSDTVFFGNGRFKTLVCFETLEHISEDRAWQAVTHLWDILAPGGRALLTVCVEGQEGWESDPTHVNVQPRAYWTEMFDRRGFDFDDPAVDRLRQFSLFAQHKGVFVLRKPITASGLQVR